MSSTDFILETINICKRYKSTKALSNISVKFAKNGIYGLFGRNGAGKTSLLNIITSRIYSDSGEVIFRGEEKLSDSCCYIPEKNYFPASYKVKNILLNAQASFSCFDSEYAERLCSVFELDKNKKIGQLSRGYQSILKIVISLASRSEITLFDEPVLGLDAVARDLFYRELLEEYSENPRLFIISTHLIEETTDIFDEIIILREGEFVLQSPVEELKAKAFYVSGQSDHVEKYIGTHKVLSYEKIGDLAMAVVEGRLDTEKGFHKLNFSPITIQNLFINITKNSKEDLK